MPSMRKVRWFCSEHEGTQNCQLLVSGTPPPRGTAHMTFKQVVGGFALATVLKGLSVVCL